MLRNSSPLDRQLQGDRKKAVCGVSCHSVALSVQTWARHVTSLALFFLICKVERTIPCKGCEEHEVRKWGRDVAQW